MNVAQRIVISPAIQKYNIYIPAEMNVAQRIIISPAIQKYNIDIPAEINVAQRIVIYNMLDFLQKTAAHFGLVITMASVCYSKTNSLVFAKKVIWEATVK